MTARVFVAIVLAFLGGMGPGAALIVYGTARRFTRDSAFQKAFLNGVLSQMPHPHLFGEICPLCGTEPAPEKPAEPHDTVP